jgi:1-phosphofructokinase family hexose kinase
MKNDKYILCGGLTPALQRTLEFDRLRTGEVNRAGKVTLSAGGKQVNTARMVQQLGTAARLTGFCGGPDGDRLRALLQDETLDFRPVPTAGNTRTCQTLIDRSSGTVTELVEEAAALESADWNRFETLFHSLTEDAGLICFSGTLPPGAPDDFIRRMLRQVSAPCIIDSHRRPLLEALEVRPRLVKLNREELLRTCDAAQPIDALRALTALGAQAVLMTDGANPALLLDAQHPGELLEISPPAIEVVNPIGSGDAVTAGIAVALYRGDPLAEAVRFGMACGAAQTLTPQAGYLPSDPAAIHRLLPQVQPLSDAVHRTV